MAKKRRRRPQKPGPGARAQQAGASAEAPAEKTDGPTAGWGTRRTRQPERPPLSGARMSQRFREPSPYPTLGASVGRGLLAVSSSLTVLLVSLPFVAVVWGILTAAGMRVFPFTLVGVLAAPPISTAFLDVLVASTTFGPHPTALSLGAVLALTVARSVVWSVLVGAILESLEYGSVSMVGVLQGLQALPSVLVIMSVNLLVVLVGGLVLPVVLGPIGSLALIAGLFGSLYFLPMAPAAAVRGRLRAGDAMRGSFRAARLPGPRHMVLVIVYFFASLTLFFVEPGRTIVTANPGLLQWVWVFAGTVIHVVFLAAFCDRWLAVWDQVPTAPAPRTRGRDAPRRRAFGLR